MDLLKTDFIEISENKTRKINTLRFCSSSQIFHEKKSELALLTFASKLWGCLIESILLSIEELRFVSSFSVEIYCEKCRK